MRTIRQLVVGSLVALMLMSPAFAQERHVIDPGVMTEAVGQHVAAQEADRSAIREALQRPEVRDVAEGLGIDLDRVSTAAGSLDGMDLQRAAEAARQLNQTLVGGQNITMSSTTIILLLVVVLLVVVVVAVT